LASKGLKSLEKRFKEPVIDNEKKRLVVEYL